MRLEYSRAGKQFFFVTLGVARCVGTDPAAVGRDPAVASFFAGYFAFSATYPTSSLVSKLGPREVRGDRPPQHLSAGRGKWFGDDKKKAALEGARLLCCYRD